MKSFLSALFGFLFSLFVEGFSRIIISFFHSLEFSFFGIDALPGVSWIIAAYLVSLIATWLGTMLALSIANHDPETTFKFVLTFVFAWIAFETLSSFKVIPAWYLITFPVTSLTGLFLAKYTYTLNQHAITDS